jgi:hypothetical protein
MEGSATRRRCISSYLPEAPAIFDFRFLDEADQVHRIIVNDANFRNGPTLTLPTW